LLDSLLQEISFISYALTIVTQSKSCSLFEEDSVRDQYGVLC